jgi:hypothetical protein
MVFLLLYFSIYDHELNSRAVDLKLDIHGVSILVELGRVFGKNIKVYSLAREYWMHFACNSVVAQ